MPNELPYTCPFCKQDLIYTGKRKIDESYFGDTGAKFFKCGCVTHYDWGDALPSNKWRLGLDGSWSYYREKKGKLSNWENMSLRTWSRTGKINTLKPIPEQMEEKVLIT